MEVVVYSREPVGLVNKYNEASIGVLKSSFTRPQAWQNCRLCSGYDQPIWIRVKNSCCSAFKMCL